MCTTMWNLRLRRLNFLGSGCVVVVALGVPDTDIEAGEGVEECAFGPGSAMC